MMEKIKQLEKETEGIRKIWKHFHSDESPDKPIEEYTKEEHDRWKKWYKEQEKLKKEHKKKYGRIQNLEIMETKLQTLKEVEKKINKRLLEARRKLKPHLPNLVKANLSGMILALEELKQNIQGEK